MHTSLRIRRHVLDDANPHADFFGGPKLRWPSLERRKEVIRVFWGLAVCRGRDGPCDRGAPAHPCGACLGTPGVHRPLMTAEKGTRLPSSVVVDRQDGRPDSCRRLGCCAVRPLKSKADSRGHENRPRLAISAYRRVSPGRLMSRCRSVEAPQAAGNLSAQEHPECDVPDAGLAGDSRLFLRGCYLSRMLCPLDRLRPSRSHPGAYRWLTRASAPRPLSAGRCVLLVSSSRECLAAELRASATYCGYRTALERTDLRVWSLHLGGVAAFRRAPVRARTRQPNAMLASYPHDSVP